MWESTTFLEMLGKGMKRGLLRQGTRRFGEPTPETLARLEEFELVEDLDRPADRFFDIESWDEFLKR